MCGIAGFSGHFDQTLLSTMSRLIAHRGPDDQGQFLAKQDGIGLAHRRLSIIDLSDAGHQPMVSLNGFLHISYNGEIYNYRELASELEQKGYKFQSRSDTEVLLHLYHCYGLDMLERLNGIYAFALWDASQKQLFVARDGVGVKPLYYCETSKGFLFASEIKALLASSEVSRELDLEALDEHLTFLWTAAPRTILKVVRKLEPGSAMLVREGRIVRNWRYYDLPYDGTQAQNTEDDLVEELRFLLKQAVNRQMTSDVPVAAFLSGGLDSSCVVAMMRQVDPSYVPVCYCIGFRDDRDLDGTPDDLPYARRVGKHLGIDLREIIVGPEIISNLDRMLYQLDEPQGDPAAMNALLIAERARYDGTKVLLSGAGGDDIFAGYRRYLALHLRSLMPVLPDVVNRTLTTWANSARGSNVMMRRIRRAFAHAGLRDDKWLASLFAWSAKPLRYEMFVPEVRTALGDRDEFQSLMCSLSSIPHEHDSMNRLLYLEGKHHLADHNLNYTDKMGMAAGVEIRVPLLDIDLIDFAAKVPPQLKQRGRQGKYILKRAMEPFLPRDVVYRPKTGFGVPLRRWLHNELREVTNDILSEEAIRRRGIFLPGAVHNLIRQDKAGRVDGAYLIFAIMCIELWCRFFIDQRLESVHAEVNQD